MTQWFRLVIAITTLLAACTERHENPTLAGQDIRVTFLHTSDIHSRLIPYRAQVGAGDEGMGLLQDNEPFGGAARMAHVIKRERARGGRVVLVDSGDCFQGAPIFNAFKGEVEQRVMSQLQPDAVVIGNHEFDEGLTNYAKQLKAWATYPVIAANYLFIKGNPLNDLVRPVEIVNKDGLKIAIIGIANFSSISSVTEVGNSLKIVPLDIVQTVQDWINVLRPQVDLIVAVSHAGLGEDEEIIQHTEGLDIILGGHLHIVLNPPKVIKDKAGRSVILTHPGAFAKFVARLDVVVRDGEVVNHDYAIFPIDSSVPEDPVMLDLLEPYRLKMNQIFDLTSVYGFADRHIRRFGFDGGDAPLGNFVAEAIRKHAWADFGLTNTLGIRTDIFPGPITMDDLFNVFPFENTITTMYMSGKDIQDLLDYTTRRSAGRGCITQVQVAGLRFTMNCTFPKEGDNCGDECPPRAENVVITNCGDSNIKDKTLCQETPINPYGVYEMATNNYIAGGGSGFTVLKINNTQVDSGVPLRDAVQEEIIRSQRCIDDCRVDGQVQLEGCTTYGACMESLVKYRGQFCEHIAETTPGELTTPYHCAVDDGQCKGDGDCYRLDAACAGGKCKACTHSLECGDGQECFQGVCVTPAYTCVLGRCRNRCQGDGDCHASKAAKGQNACVKLAETDSSGFCLPATATPCEADGECTDSVRACFGTLPTCKQNADCVAKGLDALCRNGFCEPKRTKCTTTKGCGAGQACVHGWCAEPGAKGRCAPCSEDAHCGGGDVCARGLCVAPVSQCVQGRCRALCDGNEDCPAYSLCFEGRCMPRDCYTLTDRETACYLDVEWQAHTECTTLPCPRAESDARISRILPPNLEDLPPDLDPDEPEG
ncbi:MAG: hypothetical protein AMXMBFR64_29810 [Myxococcales bacterium]